jgi:predicted ATP-dependent protease
VDKQDIGQINALNIIGIKETPIHLNNHKGVIPPEEIQEDEEAEDKEEVEIDNWVINHLTIISGPPS